MKKIQLLFLSLTVMAFALILSGCVVKNSGGNSQNNLETDGSAITLSSKSENVDNLQGDDKTMEEGDASDDENLGSFDEETDASKSSDEEVYLQGYKGGVYKWKSEDGDVEKTLSVVVSSNGAVEIQMENEQYASYNNISEAGTFTPIVYEMSGDIAGEASFVFKIETVTVTYKNYPDEPLVYKKVR